MIFGMGMPGGYEWIIIFAFVLMILIIPVMAIKFYSKSKELKKQVDALTIERKELLDKLLSK